MPFVATGSVARMAVSDRGAVVYSKGETGGCVPAIGGSQVSASVGTSIPGYWRGFHQQRPRRPDREADLIFAICG